MRLNLVWVLLASCAIGAAGRLSFTFHLLATAKRDLARAHELGRQLDEERAAALAGVERCLRIRQGVAQGRLTLDEAVDALRAEDDRRPPAQRTRCDNLPGRTHEERFCRHLIEWVKEACAGDPRLTSVLARLQGQLRRRLARLGLPPTAPALPNDSARSEPFSRKAPPACPIGPNPPVRSVGARLS
jgi:hypothetical protein